MMTRFLKQSVYFIQSGTDGPVKIGIAENPRARMRHMQTGCPDRLRLLHAAPGGPEREAELHAWLAPHHLRGEWFKPVDQVLGLCLAYEDAKARWGGHQLELDGYRAHLWLAVRLGSPMLPKYPEFEAPLLARRLEAEVKA